MVGHKVVVSGTHTASQRREARKQHTHQRYRDDYTANRKSGVTLLRLDVSPREQEFKHSIAPLLSVVELVADNFSVGEREDTVALERDILVMGNDYHGLLVVVVGLLQQLHNLQ